MQGLRITWIFLLLSIGHARHVGELLCRKCGASITRQSEIINVTASEEKVKYKYVFPLVGKNATVHVFDNPAGETFHVTTAKTAFLKFAGPRSSEYSWYPETEWSTCVCSKCGQHLGWYFQDLDEKKRNSQEGSFVGLVLDYLISADYVDSLTRVPV